MSKSSIPTRSCGGANGNLLTLPVVGVGSWSFGSDDGEYWGKREQTTTNEIVAAALAHGGQAFFDTAEAYQSGRSESALGEALKAAGNASGALIGSKILPTNCEDVRKHCEETLQRLQVDSIELYQIHWPFFKMDTDIAKVFTDLQELQKEGKIKHIGVSNFGVTQLEEALATGATIVTNQLCYNLLTRATEFDVIPMCAKHNIGVIAYSPLLQGLITGKGCSAGTLDNVDPHRLRTRHFNGERKMSRHGGTGHEDVVLATLKKIGEIADKSGIPVVQLATAWCLSNPVVISVIPGASSVAQLEGNMAAAHLHLDASVKTALNDASEELKTLGGNKIDIYESDENQRSI